MRPALDAIFKGLHRRRHRLQRAGATRNMPAFRQISVRRVARRPSQQWCDRCGDSWSSTMRSSAPRSPPSDQYIGPAPSDSSSRSRAIPRAHRARLVDQTHRGRDACAVHWGLLPTFACGVSESRRHCVAAFPRACVARPPTPIVLRAPRGRCRAQVPRRRRAACRTGREQFRDHTRGYRRLGESVPQRVVDVVMP